MSTVRNIILIFVTMIVVYELICPISQGVVYVGMTKDFETRYNSHLWGSSSDSKDKRKWCNNLKEKGLPPLYNIVSEHECKKEAKKAEMNHIVKRLEEGCNLFNLADNKLYYQYKVDGTLVNIYHTIREIKRETGISVHMNRHTCGGYIWTNGGFDDSKVKALEEAKEFKCKKVSQYTKEGIFVNEFKGVREAGRLTGIDHRSISQVAAGSKIRKSAGGYKWKYT